MSEEKLLGGQRYFISKIMEYFNYSKSQQSQMFTKALQEKRYDSITLMFSEFLEIEQDIREGTSDKTKLKHSLISSMKSILFHCKQNPLLIKGELARDISFLVKRIQEFLNEGEKEKVDQEKLNTIRISISSLVKRYDSESLIEEYIDLILEVPLSYKEIDLIVQYFISELLNLGYSFKYLSEWKQSYKELYQYIKDLDREELSKALLAFKDLIKEPTKYSIIINSWLPDELKNELETEGCINLKYRYCRLNESEEYIIRERKDKLHFRQSDKYHNLKVEVVAYDKYKAIEKVVKNLESYLGMYKHYYNFDKVAVNVQCLLSNGYNEWVQMRTDNTDAQIFNNSISARENEDIKDFLLLRDKVRKENGRITTSIKQLNNSLEMLKKSIETSPENRLLNNWSSLEYLLNSYEGKSIISKIIDIVPKVISLYLVKERLNIFWERLLANKRFHEINIVKELFFKCSKEEGKYDKNKLVDFLGEEDNIKSLFESLEKDVVMHREIAFIREVLTDLSKLLRNIENLHELIEHDLTRIYRVRNKLVHSNNNILFNNIDIFTIRLNKYINSLIGTIIHYLKRRPDLQISEVLNSIHETYEWYENFLKSESEKTKAIKKAKEEGKETGKISIDIKTASFPPYLYM